ncbi:MAG: alpha/beta hydrolase-fold protein [Chitinophagaceae bacterium]|jgi:hypothetical protein|nr:alpha/beta hydrolase-fold protein [Chitinophagaceae bacterium]
MKNILLITFFIAAIYNPLQAQKNPEPISIGEKITFYSKTLNEDRKLWIYVPDKTAFQSDKEKKYPVMFVLDGESHFYATVGLVQQLSQANLNSILPEMIIVGIENTNRFRDLTPKLNSQSSFETFLSSELIPYINENYKAAPYRILVGHSLGGLLAINILTNQPDMFNAYLAIEPSMWFNNEQVLQQAISKLPNEKLYNRKLFVSIANTLPKNVSPNKALKDKTQETQHYRSIRKLDDFFKKDKVKGLTYTSNYYANENHNSVVLMSQYDGLKNLFNYYNSGLTEKDFQDSTATLVLKLRKHYATVTNELDYNVAPPEEFIHYLASDALSKKHYAKAEQLYLFNIENYPKSNKTLAAYADFLVVSKDLKGAEKFYTKSLQLKEDNNIRQKLNNLYKPSYTATENELKQFAGEYILDIYKITITLELKEGKLISKVTGQADSEFIAVDKDVFTVKDKQGYTITFHRINDSIVGFTSVQPNGTFKATKKD